MFFILQIRQINENSPLIAKVSAFQCESSSVRSKEADPMSCRKYYNCRDGLAETQQCGEQDIFDVIFKMCRAAEVVNTCSFARKFIFLHISIFI